MPNRRELRQKRREMRLKPREGLPQEKIKGWLREAITLGGVILELYVNNNPQLAIVKRLIEALLNKNEVKEVKDGVIILENGSTIKVATNEKEPSKELSEEKQASGSEKSQNPENDKSPDSRGSLQFTEVGGDAPKPGSGADKATNSSAASAVGKSSPTPDAKSDAGNSKSEGNVAGK